MEDIKIIMEFTDEFSATFQLLEYISEEDGSVNFCITSDFEGVSNLGGGCYWCAEFKNLSSAIKAMGEIVENSEKNNGVDIEWLTKTFGKGTI